MSVECFEAGTKQMGKLDLKGKMEGPEIIPHTVEIFSASTGGRKERADLRIHRRLDNLLNAPVELAEFLRML